MRTGRSLFALVVAAWVMASSVAAPSVACAKFLDVSARGAVVMDMDTGEVIIAKNMHRKLPPASTTKVMTAILTLENAAMDDWFRVSARAASMEPTRVNLKKGDSVTVEALLYALLLKSANDAAAVLAEGIGKSEPAFARMMTAKAKRLGANDTTFKTANGLPAKGQYTTAYDLALILRHALKDRRFLDIASTRYATLHMGEGKDVALRNSNKLLWFYEGAIAGKTGYTRSARDCYVGGVECNGRRLIVSVLGSEVRWDDVRRLLDKGFELAARGEKIVMEEYPSDTRSASAGGGYDTRTGLGDSQ